MRFEIARVSIMDIEGVESEAEAAETMAALSKNTEGMTMTWQGRPIAYVRHITTVARLAENAE
jgi:hypothetical protein